MSTSGVVTAITQDWRGDTLTVAAASGDTVLHVNDAGDFSEDAATVARYLIVGNESAPRQYVDVDMDADTVTLAATVGGSGLAADEPVVLWDPTVGDSGSRAVDYVASVALHDDSGSAPALVPHELIPASGVYGLVGASVSIADDDEGEWWIERVLGREAVVDFNYLDPTTLPPAIPGQTFSTSPPSVTTGFVEGHVWWQWQAGTPPEVIGFWRLESGAWVETAIISYEVLAATNAFITYLNATDLSAATITGALFRTNASGARTEISEGTVGASPADIRMYTGNVNETVPAYVGTQDVSGELRTYFFSPDRGGGAAGLRMTATASTATMEILGTLSSDSDSASAPFSGSVTFIRIGNIVGAFGNIDRASSFSTSFLDTGVAIPAGYRPASTQTLEAKTFFNTAATYRFRANSGGTLDVQMSAANTQNMTLNDWWTI